MPIREDLRSLLHELSPILAGFKLAVILLSFFGVGSVAKWVISYWYPFTRWIWDEICQFISIPELPVVVKDSLTALVFFLPLGVTALFRLRGGNDDSRTIHRYFGVLFGVLFLFLICRDVFGSIVSAFESSTIFVDNIMIQILLDRVEAISRFVESIPREYLLIFVISSHIIVFLDLFTLKRRLRNPRFRKYYFRSVKICFKAVALLSAIFALSFFYFSGYAIWNGLGEGWSILVAVAVLFVILTLMTLAAVLVPRKLFITTGATLAFIFAAVLFEIVFAGIRLIESVPTV